MDAGEIGRKSANLKNSIDALNAQLEAARKNYLRVESQYTPVLADSQKAAQVERQLTLMERKGDYLFPVRVMLNTMGELYSITKGAVSTLGGAMARQGSKYIVFALVIMLLLGVGAAIFVGVQGSSSSKNESTLTEEQRRRIEEAKRTNMSYGEAVSSKFDSVMKEFTGLFDIPGRISDIQRMFSGFIDLKEKTTDRDVMDSGRCDNVNFVQYTTASDVSNYQGLSSTEGKGGVCVASTVPKDIEWDMHNQIQQAGSKSDKDFIPSSVLEAPYFDYDMKKTVYIPYTSQDITNMGSFYVPQCNAAYYKDRDGKKHNIDLLENKGYVACMMRSKPVKRYEKDHLTPTRDPSSTPQCT